MTKNYKPSTRQDTLKRRLIKANEILTKTKKSLDKTLLHELRRNGVVSLNDFHKIYIRKSYIRSYISRLDDQELMELRIHCRRLSKKNPNNH